ncbi:phosphate transporter [Syntrophobotulus glycolicus DSM 8271]|uniref:Phosphate transporter n=1 Tax=Syntrophobotulus glycolicus (strain DSM 8271 / FlGlyR) TaxID=645991 RepID=F0SYD3_SYNGF|nr:inorganic phosphate transporter [Syntrophobotulus glycolicus]ADY55968.1 phosphate transporter [Syntrophobotulus glycolicus DSM 8271]
MLSSSVILLGFIVILALVFDYINGFHDTANAIATSVSTRALTPKKAIIMTAILNFVGAMYSTGVAKTIAKDIVITSVVTSEVMIAALISAILWNLLTWYVGIPSSSSHAVIGGIIGAGACKAGFGALQFGGISKIIIGLLVSPVCGIALGFLIMSVLYKVFAYSSPARVNFAFQKMQFFTAGLLAFNHGSNDAQKSMGIITLSLFAAGMLPSIEVPFWVKLACAIAMAAGTAGGGWRIIRTMGDKIFKLEPINGFAADLSSSLIIWSATALPGLHLPVSTTHVASGSIIGVGMAKRIKAVRWGTAQQMLIAWVLTIPSCSIVGALSYLVISFLMR